MPTNNNAEELIASLEEKIDKIVTTAMSVKAALDKKTRTLIEVTVVVIAAALVSVAFLLWRQNVVVSNNQAVAEQAYLQALVNNRDFLQYRRDFGQTRDCPIEYFRDLLTVLSNRGDLSAVVPPCSPIDINDIDAKIADLDRRIAALNR